MDDRVGPSRVDARAVRADRRRAGAVEHVRADARAPIRRARARARNAVDECQVTVWGPAEMDDRLASGVAETGRCHVHARAVRANGRLARVPKHLRADARATVRCARARARNAIGERQVTGRCASRTGEGHAPNKETGAGQHDRRPSPHGLTAEPLLAHLHLRLLAHLHLRPSIDVPQALRQSPKGVGFATPYRSPLRSIDRTIGVPEVASRGEAVVSGGGGIRTHEGPNGPQRFSRLTRLSVDSAYASEKRSPLCARGNGDGNGG